MKLLQRISFIMVLAAMSLAFLPPAALADGEDVAISRVEAKHIVRQHMRKLGYTRTRYSMKSAQINNLELIAGNWHVYVSHGGNLPSNRGTVILNGRTGEIEQTPLVDGM